MNTLWIVLGVVGFGALLIWLLVKQSKESGKQGALHDIRESEEEKRREISNLPGSSKSDTVDRLRDGNF